MANIKEINRKILSLRSMQKIMHAMQMISSIKLRKLLHIQNPSEIFITSLNSIKNMILSSLRNSVHPVITGYKNVKMAHLIIFTGDRGLCGQHNSSVQKTTSICIEKNKLDLIETDVTCIGAKGAVFCKHKGYTIFSQTKINEPLSIMTTIKQLSAKIIQRFLKGEIHQVITISNHFASMIHHNTVISQLFPFEVQTKKDMVKQNIIAYTEPSLELFLDKAAELYLFYSLQGMFISSQISEQAARMIAMENSSNNSEDLVIRYARIRSRARQSAITNELIEIISGKEALGK